MLTGVICFIIGAVGGFVAGLLVYRNNKGKAEDIEAKAKKVTDTIKG